MSINVLHYGSRNIVSLILMILCLEKNVNGFSNFGLLGVPSNLSTLDRQRRHSFVCDVVLQAARRRRSADDTTANADAANPKLRGIRQQNFGKKLRTWMESYEALLEYKQSHQHCRVPAKDTSDRVLGRWVSELRRNGREKLSLEQLKLLDKAGFDWESKDERNNRLWQESYQKLIEYKEEHGDCCVPQKYELDKALGLWVYRQRRDWKQGRLRVDREEQLDAIGFTWSLRSGSKQKDTEIADQRWTKKYKRLLEFRDKWGHCVVPGDFDEDPSLGHWVNTQRVLFKRGLLRPDRKERLEEVEFQFAPSKTDQQNLCDRYWNCMFQHLVDYKATHGDTNVKQSHEKFGLGPWVKRQRINKTTMDEQRKTQLDEIGFLWSDPRQSWNDRFDDLREYSILNGTCNVKRKENGVLANWVYAQRTYAKKGVLPLEKRKKLESVGFLFDRSNWAH